MGYTRLPYGRGSYGLDSFIVDTIGEIKSLPTEGSPGSRAIVTDDGVEYILNNKHRWVQYSSSSGGASGGDNMTQAQVRSIVEQVINERNLISNSDLNDYVREEDLDINAITALLSQLSYDASQSGSILVINEQGEIVPCELSGANGLITTTQTGQQSYEVASNTGRGNDGEYLYECTAQQWQSFSIQDGETVKFQWNRLSYTVHVTADGDDFILGDPNGNDPYVRFTHRQDLGLNKLIAKVYQPVPSQIRDYTFKVVTGIPQDTDNLVLRANGVRYRLYIDGNGELKVTQVN